MGLAIFTVIVVALVAAFYRRHYFKIFAKIYALRAKVTDLVQQVIKLTHAGERIRHIRSQVSSMNPLPRLPRTLFGNRIVDHLTHRNKPLKHDINAHTTSTPVPPSPYVSMQELNTDTRRDKTYLSFKPVPDHETSIANQYSRHTLPRRYPRLSPMLAEMQDKQHQDDSDDLDRESSEVDEICNKRFSPPGPRPKP